MPGLGTPTDSMVVTRTTSVSLRSAQPADEAFLLHLYASTRLEELAILNWSPEQQGTFLLMQFNAQRWSHEGNYPQADWQIILRGDQPIGQLLIDRDEQRIALVDISLLPEYRSQGIGTSLLRALMSEARATHKPIRLHLINSNRAIQLYRRLGFQINMQQEPYAEMEWQPDK